MLHLLHDSECNSALYIQFRIKYKKVLLLVGYNEYNSVLFIKFGIIKIVKTTFIKWISNTHSVPNYLKFYVLNRFMHDAICVPTLDICSDSLTFI